MRRLSGTAAAVLLIAGGFTGSAFADVTYTLADSPTSSYGTIALTDGTGTALGENDIPLGTVQIVESLGLNVIASSGAGDTIEFSLTGNPSITVSGVIFSGAGGTATGQTPYPVNLTPKAPNGKNIKGFEYGINCSDLTTSACGGGTSVPSYDMLTFDVKASGGLLASDFIAGDIDGYFFVADVGVLQSDGKSFLTGMVGATAGTTTCSGVGCLPPPNNTGVPEPISLSLLGFGLVSLGVARRWRR